MNADVTACLLVKNEADRLPATLAALRGHVGRLLVIDSGSDDGTPEIARAAGAEVVERPWDGWVAARNAALALIETPWVLMLDADEVFDEAFWAELAATGFPDVAWKAAEARRETHYLGRPMRYAWQPDWKAFLFRVEGASFIGGAVHERLLRPGARHRIAAKVAHFSYRSFDDHVVRMRRYASLGADDLIARGVRVGWLDLTLRPIWHVVRMLLVRRAVLDGVRGWIAAFSAGMSVWLRYVYAWSARRASGDGR